MGARDPLLEIVSDHNLELRAFLPSQDLRSVAIGAHLELTVDETGQLLPAKVIAVGARIDNVSQLIEVRADFIGDVARLIPGMSGNVRVMTDMAAVPNGSLLPVTAAVAERTAP